MDLRDLPPTISVAKAAALLGISRNAAYQAIAAGQLPALRLGRRLLVPTARLAAMLGVDAPGGVRRDVAVDAGARA